MILFEVLSHIVYRRGQRIALLPSCKNERNCTEAELAANKDSVHLLIRSLLLRLEVFVVNVCVDNHGRVVSAGRSLHHLPRLPALRGEGRGSGVERVSKGGRDRCGRGKPRSRVVGWTRQG